MIEQIIKGMINNMKPEQKAQLGAVNEFLPIIDTYHKGLPLNVDGKTGELDISYLIRFEDGRMYLYQVALGTVKVDGKSKVVISRELNKTDITAEIEKLTKEAQEEIKLKKV